MPKSTRACSSEPQALWPHAYRISYPARPRESGLGPIFAAALLIGACSGSPGDGTASSPPETTAPTRVLAELAGPALALNTVHHDEECPVYDPKNPPPFSEPPVIRPGTHNVLETQLVVALRHRCVPVWDGKQKHWSYERLELRTYGYPTNPSAPITEEMARAMRDPAHDDPAITWSAPGPTFEIRKASAADVNDGTNFRMTLFNALEPDPNDDYHSCVPLKDTPSHDKTPNCFHGNNATNFHFHGFHVSPQEHQDFVGLELRPFPDNSPEHSVATHGARGVVKDGQYFYDVHRLRYTQAEGTHWYHAHKHGSTALQVLNGLVGTFKIRGAFDDEIARHFAGQEGGFKDRIMVVQQVQKHLPGTHDKSPRAGKQLINGLASPRVSMRPGEIQRWRFVGATMQASAQLEIGFMGSKKPEVRQIAMDGVQFSPENYGCQPFLGKGPDCVRGTLDDTFDKFKLHPGNRIDILIQAPLTRGTYTMAYEIAAQLDESLLAELAASNQDTNPNLLTLVVEGKPIRNPVDFPTEDQFPAMPPYLGDIEKPSTEKVINYQMNDKRGVVNKVPFMINGLKYNPQCVNETLVLDRPEAWILTNNSTEIEHPFHIHTNPFQLISTSKQGRFKHPIWMDVVPIPLKENGENGQALIYYVAKEFTGEFVNHCHILGHEDRGMMHGVQVVCPDGYPKKLRWGTPTENLRPECAKGRYRFAAPTCS